MQMKNQTSQYSSYLIFAVIVINVVLLSESNIKLGYMKEQDFNGRLKEIF